MNTLVIALEIGIDKRHCAGLGKNTTERIINKNNHKKGCHSETTLANFGYDLLKLRYSFSNKAKLLDKLV
jgi:hypothetical protein